MEDISKSDISHAIPKQESHISGNNSIYDSAEDDERNGVFNENYGFAENKCGMDWEKYHRLDTIYSFLDELESTHPSTCTVYNIGRTVEGRFMKLLRISNSNASNSRIWLDAGIHSREWIGPAVVTYIANYIIENYDELPNSLTNKDWPQISTGNKSCVSLSGRFILPVVNADGYEYTHTKDRMWRKNRARHQGKCVGVDLNRNFSLGWGERGSSEIPSHVFYRGPQPFSEPESIAIKDIISNSSPKFKVYLTFHSYGQVIIFPYAFSNKLCPDYMNLLGGATAMSKAIYESSGRIYRVGISTDIMYYAAGTSTDWSHGVARIPYCYLLELGPKQHKFCLPEIEILDYCREVLAAIKALMKYIDEKSSKLSLRK